MITEIETVKKQIRSLGEFICKHPFVYFNEADIQAELFSRLLVDFGDHFRIPNRQVWGVRKQPSIKSCITRRLHSELLLPEGRIDIAIVDPAAVHISINSKGRFGHIQLSEGNHIFIEVKVSRTNRSSITSKNQWIKVIEKDLEKLIKYTHTSIMFCFDFNKLIDKTTVTKMKKYSGNVQVEYFSSDLANDLIIR